MTKKIPGQNKFGKERKYYIMDRHVLYVQNLFVEIRKYRVI